MVRSKAKTPKVKPCHDIVDFVVKELAALADRQKACEMAAYMKTDMPFYGVQKPDREPILRAIKLQFPPSSRLEYESTIEKLFSLPHREEKYMSLGYASQFVDTARPESLALFERLVRDGAWWDFVDMIASHLVGHLLKKYRGEIAPLMDEWIDDADFWIRRTAILSQLKHKKETDEAMLFRFCLKCADEKEFFIRKAIGWALREYSYSNPAATKRFLLKNRHILSPLSFKEGAKALVKHGHLEPD